jgi:chemotaxis family two-component system sensor kinase Cph1
VGFDTQSAATGKEAVEIFKLWSPNLILMDMRMPVMDGYEATRLIRETLNGETTAIIALTASAFVEDRSKMLEGGCDDFVRKPFKENEIFTMLAKYLNVQFSYETLNPSISKAEGVEHLNLTKDLLLELPKGVRLELKNAMDFVDYEETINIIEKIPAQHKATAEALRHLIEKYRFEELQELLE